MANDKYEVQTSEAITETIRISNPLDDINVGDFYWVRFDEKNWYGSHANAKVIGNGEIEELMCVDAIGSNYAALTIYRSNSSSNCRIHFDEFMSRCRPEPNWRAIMNHRMEDARKAIQEKTRQLITKGKNLCLIPDQTTSSNDQGSFLPSRVSVNPEEHKIELVKLQKSLPEISREIEGLGKDLAVAARNISLPDLVKLGEVRKALEVVEDKIFTIELYCGILEHVVQIATGKPADIETQIVIRQQILYMDEETLFDYDDGGMDFSNIEEFDQWVVKSENLSRILPDQRGIVGFRVRRKDKDYGHAKDLITAWAHMVWKDANRMTYLLIRNGENVYRISSEVDFTPRLIPKEGEIGKDQLTKIHEKWVWNENKDHHVRVQTETTVTPNSIDYDDHVNKVERLLQHYNRIVILIQGMLDRSMIFHPHQMINLRSPMDMEKWIKLVRDEERALPSNVITFEAYQKQLNSTIRKGKWIYIDSEYNERFKDGEDPNDSYHRYQERGKRGWATNSMPRLCKVDSIKRDGSAVKVSWPWGNLSTPKQGKWIASDTRPGWGNYETIRKTDRMCHEWIPIDRVLNVSDYTPGDYKMFLCDRSLLGAYLEWARYLLTAEDWSRERAKGIPPEDDKKAKPVEKW